jgi:C4-dicarboxylate-specific signal transduction histidine kinase
MHTAISARAWNAKLSGALARGYPGMRVSGNTAWLEKKDWKDFCEYEEQLNSSITDQPMAVLCTYPLMTSGAAELLDVARNHQFAIAKRQGTWEVIETTQLQASQGGNGEGERGLEQRVIERTVELDAAQAERRQAEVELAHVTRVTTLGELASSMAHELNQPLAAVVTNGNACLLWLARDEPNLEEATKAVTRMIRDANRAADVIAHTRALLRRSSGEKTRLDVGDVIRDALTFVEPEALRHRVAIRKMIAADLPAVWGDRVQLQQVILNLVVNGIEAMTDVPESDRARDFRSGDTPRSTGARLLVAVEDSGVGVTPERLDRLFEPFYTTKPAGLGMGLPISRSLVQAHGGQLSATRNAGHGTTFRLILPAAGPSDD